MKLLRKIFGGLSLTAAMFVFQACYGTMPSNAVDIDEIVDSLDESVVESEQVEDSDLVVTGATNDE